MPAPLRAVLRILGRIVGTPGRLLIGWIDRRKAINGVGPLNRFQRGSVHVFIGFCVMFVLIAISAEPTDRRTTTTNSARATTAAAPTSTPTTTSPRRSPTTATERGPAGPAYGVDPTPAKLATVTDGDTFQITTGEKVRVLGIDSCEDRTPNKTPGGAQATSDAGTFLRSGAITLTREPGAPDRDGNDRLLRYVHIDGKGDLGLQMIGWDHTGIYTDSGGRQGGDAGPGYLAALRAHDLDHATNPPSGRECGEYPPPVTYDDSDDSDVYVPIPDDDDNDRGESRFCRKRWWC